MGGRAHGRKRGCGSQGSVFLSIFNLDYQKDLYQSLSRVSQRIRDEFKSQELRQICFWKVFKLLMFLSFRKTQERFSVDLWSSTKGMSNQAPKKDEHSNRQGGNTERYSISPLHKTGKLVTVFSKGKCTFWFKLPYLFFFLDARILNIGKFP